VGVIYVLFWLQFALLALALLAFLTTTGLQALRSRGDGESAAAPPVGPSRSFAWFLLAAAAFAAVYTALAWGSFPPEDRGTAALTVLPAVVFAVLALPSAAITLRRDDGRQRA